jgi:myosin heavy subunit
MAGLTAVSAQATSAGPTARAPPSACTQFKNELSLLIKQINYTTPHYVRCIKPIDRQQEEAAQSHQKGTVAAAVIDLLT